jgi:hypothetical protein
MGISGRKCFIRIIGIPTAAQQAADNDLLCIPTVAVPKCIKKPEIVAVHVFPRITCRCDPFPTGPPGRCGKEERQIILEADVQVLPIDRFQSRTFRFVIDKGRVDDIRIELQVAVSAQTLDDSPLAKDKWMSLKKFREKDRIHFNFLAPKMPNL